MAQNFIQPKGSLKTQVDTSGLQQQLAQMFANQQLQGQAQTQAVDPMRQTVNELLKTKLMPVEMPQYATIQDIFKAPKGEKINKLGEFINTPSGQNILGGLVSLFSGGKYYSTPNDPYVQQIQHDMAVKQNQAMQQLKDQDSIVTALNNAFIHKDIADENNKRMRELAKDELEWKKQENALNRALQREQLNATIAHQRAMEGIARERLNNSGGGNAKSKVAAKDLYVINNQLDRFKNSFKTVRPTKPGALLANAYADKGFGNEDETYFNAQKQLLVNAVTRTLGGEKGVMSDQDIARFAKALPELGDDIKQKNAKLRAAYDLLGDRLAAEGIAFDNPYNQNSSASMPNVNMSAIEAEMKRRGLK